MQSQRVFKFCEGISYSSFYVKEFDVIVPNRWIGIHVYLKPPKIIQINIYTINKASTLATKKKFYQMKFDLFGKFQQLNATGN